MRTRCLLLLLLQSAYGLPEFVEEALTNPFWDNIVRNTANLLHVDLDLDDDPPVSMMVVSSSDVQDKIAQEYDANFRGFATCMTYNTKCKKCVETKVCSFCESTGYCVERSQANVCHSTWVEKKSKCPGGLRWWGILLIVLACVCLCPLITACCFIFVVRKICCPNDREGAD